MPAWFRDNIDFIEELQAIHDTETNWPGDRMDMILELFAAERGMTMPSVMTLRALTRAAVVAEARSWIGTPYHHAADVKGHGVDCAMLLVRVYCDLGLIEPFDPRPYTRDWFLHRSEERYLGFLFDARA